MDSSMQSPIYLNSARNNIISRTRQSSASSVSSKKFFGGPIKKSLNSGRFSLSGRSNQSLQIIARSDYNIVEPFGSPLPVLVGEALTFMERNVAVSINCSDNGWAWTVYGRRLLVWQYNNSKLGSPRSDVSRTSQRRIATAQCRELTLPHCDIGHKSSLIKVFIPEGQKIASCLAVSPTGDVRYWPSVAHDGSSFDSNGILEGQEFDDLLSISQNCYVLVTTTCNLVLLYLRLINGRHTIQHRPLKTPSGFFGGIGKKFASILIGMNNSQDKEHRLVRIAGCKSNKEKWDVIVLADRWVQKWLISFDGNEEYIFEDHDIVRKIREEFYKKIWAGRCLLDNTEVEVYLLDMQCTDHDQIILAGAVNNAYAPQMHFALVTIKFESENLKITNFNPLKLTLFFSPETENDCFQLKFIINSSFAFVYGERIIYIINRTNLGNEEFDVEKIEFQNQDDKIMHASVHSEIPLFFTCSHGLVCITPSDFSPADLANSSFTPDVCNSPFLSDTITQSVLSTTVQNSDELNLYELDPDEIYNQNKDEISQMKAALIYYLKRNNSMCNAILRNLVPSENISDEVDSQLDQIIVSIAEDLAEDIPAADPRWERQETTTKIALGSSMSLQIIQQLREKNLAMSHYVEFLHSTEIWEKLNAVTYKGSVHPTWQVLSDINEKIISAIALRNIQNSYSKLIDEAINEVLGKRNEHPTGNLVNQDLFYVKITKINEIFFVFTNMIEEAIKTQVQPSLIAITIRDVLSIILAILKEIITFREKKSHLYNFPSTKGSKYEILPWTASSGKHGLRDTLLQLVNNAYKYGARSIAEIEVRQKIYQQTVEIIDFILDGRKQYLESIKDTEKYSVFVQQYESQRRDLIQPLVEDEQYELAAKLAEKYLDFQILVLICDVTGNQERLEEYIERYKHLNFSEFTVSWHIRKNKQGDLFERFKNNQALLSQFLGDHPSLAWIQLIFNGEMDRAAKILMTLAQDETELVDRKKTMLSLAKLASFAAGTDSSVKIAEINSDLQLIDYQDQIPDSLLNAFGYDVENQKVLRAEEIINLFISEENITPNEFEYRKALELLNYVEDPFEVRHKILCSAILRDSWTDYDVNKPLDKMQSMLFFKLIDLCYLMDGDLEDFLPPIEDFLNSPELGDLIMDKSFQYLLKLGYEHALDTYNKIQED